MLNISKSGVIEFRLKLFKQIPSMTNVILLYQHLEALILLKYSQNKINPEEKDLEKFEKLKNLAMHNSNIPERILAVEKSVQFAERILEIKFKI